MIKETPLTQRKSRFAFTFSPAPKLQRNDPLLGHVNIMPILKKLRLCCAHVELYPEMHINGTLHYHGIIIVSDFVKWYKSVLPLFKRNGFVVLKSNLNSNWDKYITKDWDIVKDILELDKPIDLMVLKKKKQKHLIETPDIHITNKGEAFFTCSAIDKDASDDDPSDSTSSSDRSI